MKIDINICDTNAPRRGARIEGHVDRAVEVHTLTSQEKTNEEWDH